MGKHGKKQSLDHRRGRKNSYTLEEDEGQEILDCTSSLPTSSAPDSDQESQEVHENSEKDAAFDGNAANGCDMPSKFSLYQQSVQSPRGDISYLQKFFMMYVGGRVPLHLQEDFCGTALLSVDWLHVDARRTAIGIDLDDEALKWSLENNVNRIGADISSRISLFHGNVLLPLESKLVNFPDKVMENTESRDGEVDQEKGKMNSLKSLKDKELPLRDIVCAFNYSCCCLHNRRELILYFKNALNSLSKKGGIFVMDLYGGTSSEGTLKLRRRFNSFTYTWEQAEFDIIHRKTRISLHFNLHKQHRKLRHAFSYTWRLWSLPEVKDCLEEAGFRSVHFWICSMPDSEQIRCTNGLSTGRDLKYEEATSFLQQDSWNAYIVAVV